MIIRFSTINSMVRAAPDLPPTSPIAWWWYTEKVWGTAGANMGGATRTLRVHIQHTEETLPMEAASGWYGQCLPVVNRYAHWHNHMVLGLRGP